MGYTDGSCCEDKIGHGALPARAVEGEIKERRGGLLEETDVRAAMFTKEERREGMEGGLVQGTRRGRREPTGCQEKEKRTVLKDGECSTMLRPHEKGKLKGPTQMAFTRHEA